MVDVSAVARVLGIGVEFKDLRGGGVLFKPQQIAVIAQGRSDSVYSLTKFQATSAAQVGAKMGWGSPAHLIVDQLFPANGDGVGTIPVTVYPLEDAYEGVAAVGRITPTGTQSKAASYRVRVNGILSEPFVIDAAEAMGSVVDSIVEKVNAVLKMPALATDGDTYAEFTAKWAGETGNDMHLEVIGEDLGVTFTIIQPTGGLVNPDISSALAQFGSVWESLVINQMNIDDEDTLDLLKDFGEGRWGELVRKPLMAFTGNTIVDATSASSVVAGRQDDRVNVQIPAPGSVTLPFVIAARGVARIAKVANNDPAFDYGGQRLTGLEIIPGTDGEQWDYPTRDFAVKRGSSTTEVRDSVIHLSDTVTCYRPTGDPNPAYRFAVDQVKLQTILFNLDLAFATPEWDGAPMVPDIQVVTNPNARQPKHVKAVVAGIVDSLGKAAIISDPETAKGTIQVAIDSQNPKRFNFEVTVQLSGNTNIKSATLKFGFFYGTPAIAA